MTRLCFSHSVSTSARLKTRAGITKNIGTGTKVPLTPQPEMTKKTHFLGTKPAVVWPNRRVARGG